MSYLPSDDIPIIVKHCALAVFRRAKIHGPQSSRVLQAYEIAKAHLTRYGYLIHESRSVEGDLQLTQKGQSRNMKHMLEEAHASGKAALFDVLYKQATEGGGENEHTPVTYLEPDMQLQRLKKSEQGSNKTEPAPNRTARRRTKAKQAKSPAARRAKSARRRSKRRL